MTDDSTFASLGLSPGTLANLLRAGYEHPTPIQRKAIPVALAGRNLIGCAATGTGKTAAFVLPLVERLQGRRGTRGLVLAPTRELASQIAEHLDRFGRSRGVRHVVVIGGAGFVPQAKALRDGHEVIIATPGRLTDHLDRGTARLEDIEILVLDEADRMLDMGFKPQLERILGRLPKARQTMLFSATMAGEVADFAARHLTSPERVEIARSGTVAERAEQRVFHVPQLEKTALLLAILAEDEGSTLVFTRTKHRADRLCRSLVRAGLGAERIHADRSQGQRRAALEGFKKGKYRVLVATDIAARGLDIEEIEHVVNFDLPHVPADYVHRVGRTARAAATGRASSFCAPEERPLMRDIERLTRQAVRVVEVPRSSPVFKEEAGREAARQVHPGPRPPHHGVSGRPAGQPPGRHARTHPKKSSTSTSEARSEQQPRPSQVHPGPRPPHHGVSGRPAGQPPGRHARTHSKKPYASTSEAHSEQQPRNGAAQEPRRARGPRRRPAFAAGRGLR